MIIYTYLSSVLAFYFCSMEVLVVSELSLTDFQMDVMASQATLDYHQGIIQGGLTFKLGIHQKVKALGIKLLCV